MIVGCTKVRYPTRRQARHFARQRFNRYRGTRLTAYRCTECGFWHLTSQDTATKTWFRSHSDQA